jgi:predicted O-linked N-acetylglucosamine transferase (SPINDLY family)
MSLILDPTPKTLGPKGQTLTPNHPNQVFHMSPAPVQVLPGVSYFGTMGGQAMDQYISDRIGTPPEIACSQGHGDQCLYQEKMLYLPYSYQMNDHKQVFFYNTFYAIRKT